MSPAGEVLPNYYTAQHRGKTAVFRQKTRFLRGLSLLFLARCHLPASDCLLTAKTDY